MALPLARLSYPNAVLAWNMISLAAFLVSLVIVAVVLRVPRTLLLAGLGFADILSSRSMETSIRAAHADPRPACDGDLGAGAIGSVQHCRAALGHRGRASSCSQPTWSCITLAQGRIRPLMAAALSFLVLTLVTAFVLGMDTYDDYMRDRFTWINRKFRSFGYNLSIAGLWYKLFDPVGEGGWMTPLWPSPALARWGTVLSDLAITVIIATFVHRARTSAQRDLAFASVVTAMLLVSPVTWDFSLPLLLVPIAVIANSTGKSQWMPFALMLIVVVVWMPQIVWTKLAWAVARSPLPLGTSCSALRQSSFTPCSGSCR